MSGGEDYMGCGYDFVCKTCREVEPVGYGSYGSWLITAHHGETPEEWDAAYAFHPSAAIPKNRNYRRLIEKHRDHDWIMANSDYYHTRHEDGALIAEIGDYGADVVAIPDFAGYRRIHV